MPTPAPNAKTPLPRPRRASRVRALERSLRVAGWVALAWVSWGWLDARLYQAQQERLFAEELAVARLEAVAGESGGEGSVAPEAGDPLAARRHGRPGLLPGTTVELEGQGPARFVPPPAAATAAVADPQPPPAAEDDAAGDEPTAQESADAARRPPALPGDAGWSDRAVPARGSVGRLTAPRLGMGVMVAPGVDSRSLRRAAGHIPGTAAPGSDGNVGIAGHRDSFFRPLRRIEIGDELVLTTPEGTARYTVEWTRVVGPDAVEVLAPTPYPALTLVTCYPFTYVGHAPERFIVRARRTELADVSAALQTSDGR